MNMSNATGRDDKPGEEFVEHGKPVSGEIVDHATMVSLASTYVPGSEAEKKLLRKLDFRIIVSGITFVDYQRNLSLRSRVSGYFT